MYVFNHTGHVAMWNYVIDTLSNITSEEILMSNGEFNQEFSVYIESIRYEYTKNNSINIKNDCFACEYAKNVQVKTLSSTFCRYCPFKIQDTDGYDCLDGLYTLCGDIYYDVIFNLYNDTDSDKERIDTFLIEVQEVISIAKLIRDFPVRENVPTI